MNPGKPDDDPTIYFYDSDSPSEDGPYPENYEATTELGVRLDARRHCDLAREHGGPVLVAFCGTGRILIPLAREGHEATGVDISAGMLEQCRSKLEKESESTRDKLSLLCGDVRALPAPRRRYRFACIPFNSLLCIPDREGQLAALRSIRNQLEPGAELAIDLINPRHLPPAGMAMALPIMTRRCVHNGNRYTRYMRSGPIAADHTMLVEGWYDEEQPGGSVRRLPYDYRWRLIDAEDIRAMLAETGFALHKFEGGIRGEDFTSARARMFVRARAA